jgi:hypothetical protein
MQSYLDNWSERPRPIEVWDAESHWKVQLIDAFPDEALVEFSTVPLKS